MLMRAPLAFAASLGLAGCAIIPSPEPGAMPPPSPRPPAHTPSPVPAPAPTPIPTPRPEPYTPPATAPLVYAALGQTVSVDGPKVTPLKVLEDSRCPANARCVWAGQVRLRLRIKTGVRHHDLEMTSGTPVRVADGTLELVEVRPDKFTNENNGAVEPGAYRFGFRFIGGL